MSPHRSAVRALALLTAAALAPVVVISAAAAPARPDRALAVAVFGGHPRLIVGGYRGVSPDLLRAACATAEMRGECDRIGGRHVLDDAMRYLLDGDAAAAARARTILLGGLSCGDGYEQTQAGGHALAYDWVWAALSADDRRQIEATLASCGTSSATSLRGNSPHLWHGFTSQAAALALIALALDDHPSRASLLADATELFRGRALEAYAVTGGAWPEGYSYLRTHFFSGDPPYQYVVDALRAWDSAVERDRPDHAGVLETIAIEEGDWLRGLAYHLYYGTIEPYDDTHKRTLMRGGDMPTGQAYPNRQYRPFVDAVARVYSDGVLAGWGRELEHDWAFVAGDGTYHPIHRYSLPYNLPVGVRTTPPDTLPTSRMWARDDLGYAVLRSGWDEGATVVGYRAGKWFTGHQHMDQGHLDIWRNGPLAVDAGVYAAWGSAHREAYYSRTVAHNTLLIHRDGETFEQHPGFALAVNDDGQRIHTYNRRGCAQCIQSLDEWHANIGAGMHFEAGRIEAFAPVAGTTATVVQSDITAAYNSTSYTTPGNTAKVASVQRDLVYFHAQYGIANLLLVVDRVRTLAGTGAPRFALHLPARPEADGLTVVAGSADDGVLSGAARVFTVDNGYGGRLRGETILPTASQMMLIGGPEHRYWVDGANRDEGSAGLEGAPAAPGAWRVEVAPAAEPDPVSPTDHLLVHALWIMDTPSGGGAAESATASRGASDETVHIAAHPMSVDPAAPAPGLVLHDVATIPVRVVVVSAAVPRAPVRFGAAEFRTVEPATLVLTDLVPGAPYRFHSTGSQGLSMRTSCTADADGVCAVRMVVLQRFAMGTCPPPDGAGAEWQDVCAGDAPPPERTPSVTPTPADTPAVPATDTPTPTRPAATVAPASGAIFLPLCSGGGRIAVHTRVRPRGIALPCADARALQSARSSDGAIRSGSELAAAGARSCAEGHRSEGG